MTASGYKYDSFNILRELNETKKSDDGLDASLTFNIRYDIIPGLAISSIIRKGASYNTTTTEIEARTLLITKKRLPNKYTRMYSQANSTMENYPSLQVKTSTGLSATKSTILSRSRMITCSAFYWLMKSHPKSSIIPATLLPCITGTTASRAFRTWGMMFRTKRYGLKSEACLTPLPGRIAPYRSSVPSVTGIKTGIS